MELLSLNNKVKKLQSLYGEVSVVKYLDIEAIHQLRKKTREILSLISKEDSFYKHLKKVIKLTNDIRDIDVFQTVFLEKLPKKLHNKLDTKVCNIHLHKSRKKDIIILQEYLQNLSFPTNIMFLEHKEEHLKNIQVQKFTSLDNPKELHKYRIYIKQLLYNYKNFLSKEKKTIKHLESVKDYLGEINDNFNAIKRLEEWDLLDKKIQEYVEKTNLKLLKKIEKLDPTL